MSRHSLPTDAAPSWVGTQQRSVNCGLRLAPSRCPTCRTCRCRRWGCPSRTSRGQSRSPRGRRGSRGSCCRWRRSTARPAAERVVAGAVVPTHQLVGALVGLLARGAKGQVVALLAHRRRAAVGVRAAALGVAGTKVGAVVVNVPAAALAVGRLAHAGPADAIAAAQPGRTASRGTRCRCRGCSTARRPRACSGRCSCSHTRGRTSHWFISVQCAPKGRSWHSSPMVDEPRSVCGQQRSR